MKLLNRIFPRYSNNSDRFSVNNKGRLTNADPLIAIAFENRTDEVKTLWIEPACVEFRLDTNSEFVLLARDDNYRIKFDNEYVTVFLQYTFDLQLYQRPAAKSVQNPVRWELVQDHLDVFI